MMLAWCRGRGGFGMKMAVLAGQWQWRGRLGEVLDRCGSGAQLAWVRAERGSCGAESHQAMV